LAQTSTPLLPVRAAGLVQVLHPLLLPSRRSKVLGPLVLLPSHSALRATVVPDRRKRASKLCARYVTPGLLFQTIDGGSAAVKACPCWKPAALPIESVTRAVTVW